MGSTMPVREDGRCATCEGFIQQAGCHSCGSKRMSELKERSEPLSDKEVADRRVAHWQKAFNAKADEVIRLSRKLQSCECILAEIKDLL